MWMRIVNSTVKCSGVVTGPKGSLSLALRKPEPVAGRTSTSSIEEGAEQ